MVWNIARQVTIFIKAWLDKRFSVVSILSSCCLTLPLIVVVKVELPFLKPFDERTVTLGDYWDTAATLSTFVTEAVTVVPLSCLLRNYKKQTTHKEKVSGKGSPLNTLSAVLNLMSQVYLLDQLLDDVITKSPHWRHLHLDKCSRHKACQQQQQLLLMSQVRQ